jgi:hypothetical protein
VLVCALCRTVMRDMECRASKEAKSLELKAWLWMDSWTESRDTTKKPDFMDGFIIDGFKNRL